MGFDFNLPQFLTWYIPLIFAMVAHEAAHASVAYLGGDRTAYEVGQVTLNPIPHMRRAPVGMIVLPIITFAMMGFPLGFAHAPYNPYWAIANPKRSSLMAAAGPAANLVLALIFFALIKIGLSDSVHWFEISEKVSRGMAVFPDEILTGPDWGDTGFLANLAKISMIMLFLNVVLGLFNLLPFPPLDGAGIVEGLLPREPRSMFRDLRSSPTASIIGILIAWTIADRTFMPIWVWVSQLIIG